MSIAAEHIWVRGVVQGVGFRPYVYGLARRHGVAGWVRNTSAGVEILVEGAAAAVADFAEALPREAPPRAYIAACERAAAQPQGAGAFAILESETDPAAYQLVSPDIALCPDCRRELLDPADRRHGYPFTNCTNCGPRFTIIEALPYDRERTTMRRFVLCDECRREYGDPADRRFHAEPNACAVCGPSLSLVRRHADGTVELLAGAPVDGGEARPDEVIAVAAALLRGGHILAIKGLGGFHLACDATDEAVVRLLKERKRRPDKPLAVMFADLDQLRRHCVVTPAEAALLESPEHPIVLVDWRAQAGEDGSFETGPELMRGEEDKARGGGPPEIAREVAVRQRYLGAMLPYTPLHLLLLRAAGRPLVMTSGNLAEEPIVKGWEEADRLAHVADEYLLHDREIAARYDDSVAVVRAGRARLLRRSRGYAPFPVALPRPLPQVLACGAELKNTFCLTRDANAFLSQHIGDLENVETLEHFEASVRLYERLFRLEPEVVAHDLHPQYLATRYALAQQQPKVGVQHHHAHVAACMTEHGRTEPVIGVSMDGLGYGDDGALWGGEFLVCDLLGYRRAAHLEYLPLPGGDLAVRRPVRIAAGWLCALLGAAVFESSRPAIAGLRAMLGADELEAVVAQVRANVNVPPTSSCGRLFDAVAALCGVRAAITYEGQAAIELEMISRPGASPYAFAIEGETSGGGRGEAGDAALIRLAPLFEGVLSDLDAGRSPASVGSRLHATLAAIVLEVCRRLREGDGLRAVALSGGVFQNRLLSDLCEESLAEDGFEVLSHALVPANDGGLSLGQAVVAGYTLLNQRNGL